MGTRGSGKGPTIKCDSCGVEVAKVYLRTHKKTKACEAQTNKRRMLHTHRQVTRGDLALRVAYKLSNEDGRPMAIDVFTEYTPARKHCPEEKKNTHWIPTWVATLLEHGWQLERELENAEALYTQLIRRAVQEKAFRDTLESAFRLGDAPAVRAFVETPQMRARTLVVQARRLQGEAEKLLERALAEDPECLQ